MQLSAALLTATLAALAALSVAVAALKETPGMTSARNTSPMKICLAHADGMSTPVERIRVAPKSAEPVRDWRARRMHLCHRREPAFGDACGLRLPASAARAALLRSGRGTRIRALMRYAGF